MKNTISKSYSLHFKCMETRLYYVMPSVGRQKEKNDILSIPNQTKKTDLRTDSTILTYNNDDDNDDILKLTFDVKTCSLLPYNGYVVVVE